MKNKSTVIEHKGKKLYVMDKISLNKGDVIFEVKSESNLYQLYLIPMNFRDSTVIINISGTKTK